MRVSLSLLFFAFCCCNEKELLTAPPLVTDYPYIVFYTNGNRYVDFDVRRGDKILWLKGDSTYTIALTAGQNQFLMVLKADTLKAETVYYPLKCEYHFTGYAQSWDGDNAMLQVNYFDGPSAYGHLHLQTSVVNGLQQSKVFLVDFFNIEFR